MERPVRWMPLRSDLEGPLFGSWAKDCRGSIAGFGEVNLHGGYLPSRDVRLVNMNANSCPRLDDQRNPPTEGFGCMAAPQTIAINR